MEPLDSWKNYSYKELAKTRDDLGNDEFADAFNKRLKDVDQAVKALEDVEKLIFGFDMSVIYMLNSDASYILAKQILYSYRLLLKEVKKKLINSFDETGLTIDDYLIEKSDALNDLLDGYLVMLDVR
jgi:hypothetical protein